ncbi:MAG: amidase [Pseudomonadota bacterium]
MKVTPFQSISELGAELRSGLSPTEVTEACLARINHLDPALNAFIAVTPELARSQARTAADELAIGRDRGPLHGVPVALKDLLATKGIATTFASRAYADWVPDFDATVVERLQAAGAVIVGKTNLSEGAADSSSVSSAFGPPRNPWDPAYITGGSSGGSAAAVAAGMAYAAIGSDTAMSIRQPSALCGLVGLKPTYGRVSKFGAMALSFSLDHLGPMTRCVADAALVLAAIAGPDDRDPTSAAAPVPDLGRLRPPSEMRIGLSREWLCDELDADIALVFEAALDTLSNAGARITESSLPHLEDLYHLGSIITAVEGAAYHNARYDEVPERFGVGLGALVESGRTYSGVDYVQAQRVRRHLVERVMQQLSQFDVWIAPTTSKLACRIDDDEPSLVIPRMRNTLPFNVIGVPAVSVPGGFDQRGLPVGIQFIGQPFAERELLGMARFFESLMPKLDYPDRMAS